MKIAQAGIFSQTAYSVLIFWNGLTNQLPTMPQELAYNIVKLTKVCQFDSVFMNLNHGVFVLLQSLSYVEYIFTCIIMYPYGFMCSYSNVHLFVLYI